jgi:hypothetical protein
LSCPSRNGRAPIGALENLVEIKAREKFNRRHMVDIPILGRLFYATMGLMQSFILFAGMDKM